MRIHRIGLPAVAGSEHPHLRRQLGRHVDHCLAVVHKRVRDVLSDAVAALDRPQPIRVLAASGQHLGIAGLAGAVPADRQHLTAVVDDLDRWPTACVDPSR